MSSDVFEIENAMVSLIPDVKRRRLCLSLFAESLIEASTYGAHKWGTYCVERDNRLRLLVGSLIVLTLHEEGMWITLDQSLLKESEAEQLLDRSRSWLWDTGRWSKYARIPSRNGYYVPSNDHTQIWPIIRELHFSYIGKAACKFSRLRVDSQRKHMPQVVAYLRQILGQHIPQPVYTNPVSSISPTNPLHEIQQYQSTYQSLPETERETIAQSRIGQGKFRNELMNYWQGCAVTNCQQKELLRASHIKPWRDSTNKERLDVFNGLLLIPNLDAAFDCGMISFENDGTIMISEILTEGDRKKLGISRDMRITRINEQHRRYLEYHRNHIFLRIAIERDSAMACPGGNSQGLRR
jgi:5-methylcytosine-specific restriction protein A